MVRACAIRNYRTYILARSVWIEVYTNTVTLQEMRDSSAIGHKEVLQYAPRRWYDALFLVRSPTCSFLKRGKKTIVRETDEEGSRLMLLCFLFFACKQSLWSRLMLLRFL
jgi:hypothetical protein